MSSPSLPTTRQIPLLLMTAPSGLGARDLLHALRPKISQPTLWRLLDALRAGGLVSVTGRGRATRYHAAGQRDLAALRSLAMHRAAARRLATDPAALPLAVRRLQRLRTVNPHGRSYHDRWQALLEGPLPALLRAMTEDCAHADALRKESPFTVLVDPVERRRIFGRARAA